MDAMEYQSVGEAIARTQAPEFDYVGSESQRYAMNARSMGEQLARELELRGFQIVRLPG